MFITMKQLNQMRLLRYGYSCRGISTVGVVGMGLMGHGIAQLCCDKFKVIACDTNGENLKKGMSAIEKSLTKQLAKSGAASGDVKSYLGNIQATTNVSDLKQCDIVIEAIIENLDIKKNFYKELSKIAKKDAILASNTSSFPISELAGCVQKPENVIGLHFFNPVQMMKLVEIVRTEKTDEEIFNNVVKFVEKIGKVAVKCKDSPGFIVNRLLVPYIIGAIELLERNDAAMEDIDTAMKLGAGHPMGPIQLADYVGLDTVLYIMQGWQKKYPDNPDFRVPKLLTDLVKQGKLGRKSGQGFYKWDGNKIA